MGRVLGRWSLVLLGVALASTAAAASGDWLDRTPLPSWNKPGAKLPQAPRFDPDPFLEKRCGAEDRKPSSDIDRALVKAGWHLVGEPRRQGDLQVVMGRSGSDGMCRPLGFQLFVFVGGRYAGTLAPRHMDSRSDGAAWFPELGADGSIAVPFSRYAKRDPLCCPSRTSTVRFRIDTTPKGPVAVATGVTTVPNEPASPDPVPPTPAAPPPTPAAPPAAPASPPAQLR